MPTNLSDTTVPLTQVFQVMTPIAVAAMGGAGWTIKRVVGKIEKSLEDLQEDMDDLNDRCRKAEDRIRKERADAIRELGHELGELRKSCELCREQRTKEYTNCVDTYGKFGARVSKLEGEHALHHQGALCSPIR